MANVLGKARTKTASNNNQESMMLVIQRNINEIRDKEKRYPVSIMANSSVINLLSGEPGWETRNFDAELQKFQEKNIKEEE